MWSRIKFLIKRLVILLTPVQVTLIIGRVFLNITGRKNSEINLSGIKSVLVLKLDHIGDMVCTTPFLRELRRNLPNAWITLIVKPANYNLMEDCPYINEVLIYDWSITGFFAKLLRNKGVLWPFWQVLCVRNFWPGLRFARQYLKKRNFDLAIIPRWGEDFCHGSFIAYFSGAPLRIAYSEHVTAIKNVTNHGFDHLMTHVLDNNAPKHLVELSLDIIRFVNGKINDSHLELWLKKEDDVFADNVLKENGRESARLLISVAPGAGEPKRRWPISGFIELLIWLQSEYDAGIFIVGGKGEEILGQQLHKRLGDATVNFIGKTSLRHSAALIKRTSLFIGNDSGLMHIAAAIGVPVVGISCHAKSGSIYSTHSPLYCAPWGPGLVVRPDTLLNPCVDECKANRPHCILNISPDELRNAVKKMLQKQRIENAVS